MEKIINKIFIKNISLGVMCIDLDYKITAFNPWLEKHSDLNADEVIGRNVFDLLPEIRKRGKEAYIVNCIKHGRSAILSPLIHKYLLDLTLTRNDRYIQMIQEVKIFPLYENDEILGAMMVIKDLTEQVEHEKELINKNKVLNAIRKINRMMSRVTSEKMLFSESARILARDIDVPFVWFGKTKKDSNYIDIGEFDGIESDRFRHILEEKNDFNLNLELTQKVVETGKIQVTYRLAEDQELKNWWALFKCFESRSAAGIPLKIAGDVLGVLHIFTHEKSSIPLDVIELFQDLADDISLVLKNMDDIEKRKQAEADTAKALERLHQAQKMESIGTLAGGIAHDFNNILSAIMGFTELTLDEVERGSLIHDNMTEVYTAANRAKELVKQILTFARKTDEERHPLNIDIIANEVLKFIRSSIPSFIEIRQKIDSDSQIMGSPTHVYQILMNLCTNASQAMEDKGGILELSIKDVEINDDHLIPPDTTKDEKHGTRNDMDFHTKNYAIVDTGLEPGDYIEIRVSDTGNGIAPDIMNSIFDPYFTTKDVGKGTGMGLAVVHGIVESYGGRISVASKLGQGTLFTTYLPIIKKRKPLVKRKSEEFPLGTERVLFVDDEAPIAKLGGKILEQLGYKVSVCTSSIDAMELFRLKPNEFDLVITDMTMANMTGDILTAELLRIRPDIPVILCTGYSSKIFENSVLENAISALIYKPITKMEMAKTVRKVLDERKGS